VIGFVASVIVFLPNKKQTFLQFSAVVLYLFLIIGMIFTGINETKNAAGFYLTQIDESIMQGEYQTVVELATIGLENTSDMEQQLRFQRSYANIHLNNTEDAKDDLLKITEIDPSFAEAYHNLALIYHNEGDIDNAKEAIKRAVDLSNSESNKQLYELIFGEKPTSKIQDNFVLI